MTASSYLTFLNGPQRGETVEVIKLPTRLGRDSHIEITLDDPKTSRIHAQIDFNKETNSWKVQDLHSKNGSYLNDKPLEEPQMLCEGDRLVLGETQLVFSMLPPPPRGPRTVHDSMMVGGVPLGVRPALGTAGVSTPPRPRAAASKALELEDEIPEEGNSFETLELHAPLNLLRSKPETIQEGLETDEEKARDKERRDASGEVLELTRANQALRTLYDVARAVAEAASGEEILSILSSRLRAATGADRVWVLPVDEHGHWSMPNRNAGGGVETEKAGRPKAAKALSQLPISRTIVDYALRTRRAVLTAPNADERFSGARSVGEQGITSAQCVPIVHGGKTQALLYADRLGGKPFDHHDQELAAAACLQAAPALAGLRRMEAVAESRERLLEELQSRFNMLGNSPPMKATGAFIERVAPSDAGVLILGESGTGKELVARAIHYNSRRREKPFVAVNCAALSESLIESELFGHVKGAFTGAAGERQGRFELAHTGTIFLDEIGELSPACQTKLLRVLEEGQLSRVGESRVRQVDVRIIAATNRDLAAEVEAGRFRTDLYYRLNVLSISLPPLRERGRDVRLLLEHYLKTAAAECGRPGLRFSEEAFAVLSVCPWPGNIRELRNLTERVAVLTPSEVVGVADLPPECRTAEILQKAKETAPEAFTAAANGSDIKATAATDEKKATGEPVTLAEMEKVHILRTLKDCGGNKKAAAEKLGIDRSTLYAKLRAYGI